MLSTDWGSEDVCKGTINIKPYDVFVFEFKLFFNDFVSDFKVIDLILEGEKYVPNFIPFLMFMLFSASEKTFFVNLKSYLSAYFFVKH